MGVSVEAPVDYYTRVKESHYCTDTPSELLRKKRPGANPETHLSTKHTVLAAETHQLFYRDLRDMRTQ